MNLNCHGRKFACHILFWKGKYIPSEILWFKGKTCHEHSGNTCQPSMTICLIRTLIQCEWLLNPRLIRQPIFGYYTVPGIGNLATAPKWKPYLTFGQSVHDSSSAHCGLKSFKKLPQGLQNLFFKKADVVLESTFLTSLPIHYCEAKASSGPRTVTLLVGLLLGTTIVFSKPSHLCYGLSLYKHKMQYKSIRRLNYLLISDQRLFSIFGAVQAIQLMYTRKHLSHHTQQ